MNSYMCRTVHHGGAGCCINGVVELPGCGYASCVALIIASQAIGESRIYNISKDDAVLHVGRALESLGIGIFYSGDNATVVGVGTGGFAQPEVPINTGGLPAVACISLGILATYPFTSFITGCTEKPTNAHSVTQVSEDMLRIMEILSLGGAKYLHNGVFPVAITGFEDLPPLSLKEYTCTSDLVKTALLFACTNIAGENTICASTRLTSCTEVLLRYFGAEVTATSSMGKDIVTVRGHEELFAREIKIFPCQSYVLYSMAAAMIFQGSAIEIKGAFIDKAVECFIDIFNKMGGDISATDAYNSGQNYSGLADICAKSSKLKGVVINCRDLPMILPELPLVCVMCACAEGITVISGLSELEVYQRHALLKVTDTLKQYGVAIQVTDDHLEIRGRGATISGDGVVIDAGDDYRVAIPFLILGLATRTSLVIKGYESKEFVEFVHVMNVLGKRGNFVVEFVIDKKYEAPKKK